MTQSIIALNNIFLKTITTISMMVVFLFNFNKTNAQIFDFNQQCKTAYMEVVSLKYKSAQSLLDKEQREHPKNLIPIYLENYLDFIELFTSENKSRFQLLKQNQETRIVLLQKGDKNSPYYLFTQAEIYIQWAVIKIKFGDYISAVINIRKANKLLSENALKFKDFKPNQKSIAILQCLFGSIPDNYKWGGSLLGLEGDIEKGTAILKTLINSNDYIYKEETLIIYALIQFHLNNQQEDAWNLLKKNNYPLVGNAMSYYIVGYIGTYGGHSALAQKSLEEMPRNNSIYLSVPIVDYFIGLCKLYALDKSALFSFDTFLKNYKGENYKKAIYQKIAWSSLIHKGYDAYKVDMAKVKETGVEVIDADKQAQKEALSGVIPDVKLLKLRLLCDGGNYEKAKVLEQTIKEDDFKDAQKKLEFLYRKARISHLTKNINQSIIDYKKVVDTGKDLPFYYAANAALNLGYIYEVLKNKPEAIRYYKICLSMKNHEYVNSLSQKAKAGLNRLD